MTGITATQLANYRATGQLLGTDYDQWRPIGKTHNGTDAYSWNVSLPTGLSDRLGYGTGTMALEVLDDRVISGSGFSDGTRSNPSANYKVWAISTKEGQRGQLLFHETVTPPVANASLSFSSVSQDDGVLALRVTETRQFIGLYIDTGKQLWITEPQSQWMMYSAGSEIVNGTLYSAGYGGKYMRMTQRPVNYFGNQLLTVKVSKALMNDRLLASKL